MLTVYAGRVYFEQTFATEDAFDQAVTVLEQLGAKVIIKDTPLEMVFK